MIERRESRRVVVVGAGPAGCTVALRLARAGERVMLVETGPMVAQPAPVDVQAALVAHGRSGIEVVRTRAQSPRWYCAGTGVGGGALVNGLLMVRPDADRLAQDWAMPGWDANRLNESFDRLFAGEGLSRVSPRTHAAGERWGAAGWPIEPTLVLGDGRSRPVWAPALVQAGVDIRPSIGVDRVLIDAGRVVGLLGADGRLVEADVVVVCAGALETPRLLWRSGAQHGGIGGNVCDHPSLPFIDHTGTAHGLGTPPLSLDAPPGDDAVLLTAHGGVGLLLTVLGTRSRGWMTERNLVLGQLDHADDRARMRRLLRNIAAVDPVVRAMDGQTIGDLAARSDAALDAWMLQQEDGTFHLAGTCRMGLQDDPDAVVSSTGEVHGIKGLFIADASIFPLLPAAPPLATVMAVADIIGVGIESTSLG